MVSSVILAALKFLPLALDAGFAVRDLAREVSGKDIGRTLTPIEQYASNIIAQVPAMIDAGQDVSAILNHANEKVGQMVREGNRNPTPDEWDEVNGKIAEKLKNINKA